MAPLNRMILSVVFILITVPHSLAGAPPKRAPNAFSAIPYPRSIFIWWRPYETILAEGAATRIRSELDRSSTDGVNTLELSELLGDDIKTAFLYPVLANEGDKGAVLLRHMLDEYSDGRTLDDRWLLIVLSLGCNESADAVPVLRQELRRVQHIFAGADLRRTADAKLPIIDALLINLSRHGILTYAEVESLSQVDPDRAGAIFLLALHYAQRWMTQDQFLRMVREALHQIGDDSILRSLNSGSQQEGYLRALRDFLLAPRGVWPLARLIVLDATTLKKHAHDFILVTYLLVLTHQANASQGIYDIERAIVDQYLSSDLSAYPQASFAATILLRCTSSTRIPGWDGYIRDLAGHIRPKDIEMADYLAGETRQVTHEKQQLYDPDGAARQPRQPGIYLYGFTRAGGTMHSGDPGSPDGQ